MTPYQIAQIVLPVFGLLGLGYVCRWTGYLSQEAGEALGKFVYGVAIPLMLFRKLGTAHFPDASPWGLYVSYFTAIAVVWISADIIGRKVFGRGQRGGIIAGISASYSNLVMVGIPLVLTAYGDEGMVPLLLLIAIQLPVMVTVTTILIAKVDHDQNGGGRLEPVAIGRRIVVTLARNPIIIGMLAGSAWRIAGLGLHEIPAAAMDKLGNAAVACALFSLGMALRQYGIRGNLGPGIAIGALKLAIMPALVWLLAANVFVLPPVWVSVAVLAAAQPTGVNAYLIANHFNTGHGLAANSITLTTSAAILTIGLWFGFLGL